MTVPNPRPSRFQIKELVLDAPGSLQTLPLGNLILLLSYCVALQEQSLDDHFTRQLEILATQELNSRLPL